MPAPAAPRDTGFDADGVAVGPALVRLYGRPLAGARLTKLRGDASARSYYRFELPAGVAPPAGTPRSLVVMRLPADALASDEATGVDRPAELPFVDVQRLLASRGIRVPRIWLDDTAGRVLLLEDLGDETFWTRVAAASPTGVEALYAQAVDLLAELHGAFAPPFDPGASIAFRRRFDRALLRWELDHFREWGIEAVHGTLAPADRCALDDAFEALADAVAALPTGFVHRDYQSRNLMFAPDGSLCVIDFQDALVGPYCYDLVALLCDSYLALTTPLQAAMRRRYAERMGLGARGLAELDHAFALVAAQRKLKDAGRFVYIDRVRGNPDFLPSIPQSLVYAGRAIAALDGFSSLDALLRRVVPGFPDAVPVPPGVPR